VRLAAEEASFDATSSVSPFATSRAGEIAPAAFPLADGLAVKRAPTYVYAAPGSRLLSAGGAQAGGDAAAGAEFGAPFVRSPSPSRAAAPATPDAAPRKRGRPRKHPVKEKRKRGRPRKVPVDSTTAGVVVTSVDRRSSPSTMGGRFVAAVGPGRVALSSATAWSFPSLPSSGGGAEWPTPHDGVDRDVAVMLLSMRGVSPATDSACSLVDSPSTPLRLGTVVVAEGPPGGDASCAVADCGGRVDGAATVVSPDVALQRPTADSAGLRRRVAKRLRTDYTGVPCVLRVRRVAGSRAARVTHVGTPASPVDVRFARAVQMAVLPSRRLSVSEERHHRAPRRLRASASASVQLRSCDPALRVRAHGKTSPSVLLPDAVQAPPPQTHRHATSTSARAC
jgi:hypothetical protein